MDTIVIYKYVSEKETGGGGHILGLFHAVNRACEKISVKFKKVL